MLNDNIKSISRLTLGFAYTVRIRTLPVTTRTQDLEKKLSLQSLDKRDQNKIKRTVSLDFEHQVSAALSERWISDA